MAERENERVANPFIGLQPTVFQRKKPLPHLPPIKKTTTQTSRKPIRVVRTKKYHKIPAIETNKIAANSWPSLKSTTDLSDDVMGTETMVTSSVNIQTSCMNNHVAFFDLQRKNRDLNERGRETYASQTMGSPLMFDIDRDQTRENCLMDNDENYHYIKRQKSKKQDVRSHNEINLSAKYVEIFEKSSPSIDSRYKRLPQRPPVKSRLAGTSLQKSTCSHGNNGFVFEYSLLPRKNGKTVDSVEHTGIPCKPRLHKLHSGKYYEWPV